MKNAKYKYLNKRFTNKHGCSGFVLKYVNASEVYFQFDSGWVGCFTIQNIRNGKFRDKMQPSVFGIGFFGDGPYKSKENGKITKSYRAWTNMLKRCYDEKSQAKTPTYKGCTVDKNWHNYQTFAKWFEENYPNDGKKYDLDKDYLVKGNKIYSADTCCFLSHQQNTETSVAKRYRFISPSGEEVEIFNLRKLCRENNLDSGNMSKVANGQQSHHKGWKLCQH
jgi:hypothetical protein